MEMNADKSTLDVSIYQPSFDALRASDVQCKDDVIRRMEMLIIDHFNDEGVTLGAAPVQELTSYLIANPTLPKPFITATAGGGLIVRWNLEKFQILIQFYAEEPKRFRNW